jgi:hypothetical protein
MIPALAGARTDQPVLFDIDDDAYAFFAEPNGASPSVSREMNDGIGR